MSATATAKPAQLLYPDLAEELATTRKMLGLVPDGHNDFKPHDKSMMLGSLATHLTQLPKFVNTILSTSELDFATTPWVEKTLSTTAERLQEFDQNAGAMSSDIHAAEWPTLEQSWTLRAGEQVYVTEPKGKLLRTFALSHMAHHRAQLGVYLRLLGIAIPGCYGPSADEM
ncbi:MAG: DinB family protein [Gemmatimonas sp.]